MLSTVIGGAMLPHAPQFFTMPETEDKKNVEHVREVAADIGDKLRALEPDLWIIFSNDHAEQFFHNAAPPFTVHVGGEATGEFAGRKFHWRIPSEIGFEIVRQLYRQSFDPAFTSTARIGSAPRLTADSRARIFLRCIGSGWRRTERRAPGASPPITAPFRRPRSCRSGPRRP